MSPTQIKEPQYQKATTESRIPPQGAGHAVYFDGKEFKHVEISNVFSVAIPAGTVIGLWGRDGDWHLSDMEYCA